MELFCVKPKIHYYDTFKEFAEAFEVGPRDFILTEKIIFDTYIKQLNLSANVILKDKYDTGEPNDETIDRIMLDMKGMDINRVIAVGGGSVIDIAKVITVKDAYPIGRVMSGEIPPEQDKSLIVLPTTCGTGSEVTSGGIVTMKATGLKTAIIDERITAAHAVLIPELIAGLPYKFFAFCSIDALAHSMESYLSATRGNDFARAVGAKSIELILDGYADIILHGREYRKNLLKNFLTASCLGGMAVNNGGAGPVHALAYPLGEQYKISHGESIYQFLIPVLKLYQSKKPGGLLDSLAELISNPLTKAGLCTDEKNIFDQLGVMLNMVYPLRSLKECGMKKDDIELFTDNIISTKQRLLAASYIPFKKEYAVSIYCQRYGESAEQ